MGAVTRHTGMGNGQPDHRTRLRWACAVTLMLVAAQIIGFVVTGSLALLTDTVHAVVDAAGLFMALIAANLALRPSDPKRTWGFRRVEVIAALAQATLLIAVAVVAFVEGVRRLITPPHIQGDELLIFGIIGFLANAAQALLLASGRRSNLNMRGAFLEVLNDMLGSLGVVVAAVVIAITGYQRADAIAGLFIAALIVPRAFALLHDSADVLMEFTPKELDLDQVREHLLSIDHVRSVHDLHASTVSTGLPTLTAHVVVDDDCFEQGHAPEVLHDLKQCVAEHFPVSIQHTTFELETDHSAKAEPGVTIHY